MPIAEGRDIIILSETREHEGCKVLDYEGFNKVSMWNEGTGTGKGHRGITILIRESRGRIVKVEKKIQINNLYG